MRNPLLAIILSVALIGPAEAHAFLESAEPAAGATLSAPPKSVDITFTQAVEPSFSTIEVTDAQGNRVDQSNPHAQGKGEVLSVDLKPLTPGDYKVVWHATSVDTHKTQGSFAFTVTK